MTMRVPGPLFVERICEGCRSTFLLKANIARRPGQRFGRFCSRSCSTRTIQRRLAAARPSARADTTCRQCGITFRARLYDLARGLGRFCTRRCSATFHFKAGNALAAQTVEQLSLNGYRSAAANALRGTNFGRPAERMRELQGRFAHLAWTKRRTVEPWPRLSRTPLGRAAHLAVRRALKNGTLTRKPCETCGSTSLVHAHHDDYLKPLVVRWLCPKCHVRHHLAEPYIAQAMESVA